MPQYNRENRRLGNEAPLNFVALRSLTHGVGSGGLSRVFDERPAGALDSASEPPRGTCVLDEADDFIDVVNRDYRNFRSNLPRPGPKLTLTRFINNYGNV